MNLFTYLPLGHLIGDFLLQSAWMAMNKSAKWIPLLTHCVVYTASVSGVAFIGSFHLSIVAIALIFSSHVFLDRRNFVLWWTRVIMDVHPPKGNWLIIMTDQIFHILILGCIAHFASYFIH